MCTFFFCEMPRTGSEVWRGRPGFVQLQRSRKSHRRRRGVKGLVLVKRFESFHPFIKLYKLLSILLLESFGYPFPFLSNTKFRTVFKKHWFLFLVLTRIKMRL